jgi:hypothetical protein
VERPEHQELVDSACSAADGAPATVRAGANIQIPQYWLAHSPSPLEKLMEADFPFSFSLHVAVDH